MNSWLTPSADLAALTHELVLVGGGIVLLLLEAFAPRLRRATMPLALLTVLGTLAIPWEPMARTTSFAGLLESTGVTMILSVIILIATLISILASEEYLRRYHLASGEYAALLLWCAAGMLLMLRATELLTIFVALELFSMCLYALAGYHRRSSMATEAAIKYFLMGAFVSAFALLGIALLYGQTGSTRFEGIAAALGRNGGFDPAVLMGLILLIAAFGFKMSFAPFHAWAPDTYQGAPSPFVAFLSVAPKVASVAVLVRVIELAMTDGGDGRWRMLIGALAALSMILGNVLALVQRDIKRMLAYSGVAHMGFVLIPLAAWNPEGWRAITAYMLAYALMNAGAFAIISALYARGDKPHLISEISGWGYRFPGLSMALAVCMLSLGGIPPTIGFLGKYLVFVHAVQADLLWLAVIGVVTSLLGVFYYLRVVFTLYMKPEETEPSLSIGVGNRLAALIAAGAILALGLFPEVFLGIVQRYILAPLG